jgi:branched-chain amino acid transport system ATP-binding protein
MLAIGSAMMPAPAALLLDEPSAGLSPRAVGDMLAAVRRVNQAGVTVLMIEQNLVEAIRICDAVVLIVGGDVRGQWRAEGFLDDPQARALFFGGARGAAGRMPVHAGGAGDAGAA